MIQLLWRSSSNRNPDVSIVVDRAGETFSHTPEELQSKKPDLVVTNHPPQKGYRFLPTTEGSTLARIGQHLSAEDADGEFIGLAMFSEEGARLLGTVYQQSQQRFQGRAFHEADSLETASFTDILQEIVDCGGAVASVAIYKGWLEIDTFEDYRRAWTKVK